MTRLESTQIFVSYRPAITTGRFFRFEANDEIPKRVTGTFDIMIIYIKLLEVPMKKKHLPVLGVGPLYAVVVFGATAMAVFLDQKGVLPKLSVSFLRIPLLLFGLFLIVVGIVMYFTAIFHDKISQNIVENTLVTTGAFAYVRNPIYSVFLLVSTGILCATHNIAMFVLPFLFWGFLTLLLKATEEKWLLDLYGEEYRDYCRRVHRVIPRFPKNK